MGSVVEQRLAFVSLVASGVPIAEAARRFSISRPTAYKWLTRYHAEGEPGLVDRSRRPLRSPQRVDAAIEELICDLRERHPTWGGRKLRASLLRQGYQRIPAASTITRVLTRQGYIKVEQSQPKAWKHFEADDPNDMWQIDFKGHFPLTDGARCHPLGVLDDHSRYNLCLQACRHETTAIVKGHLTDTFKTYGLPKVLLTDNGPPWGSTNPTYRWSSLKVWLIDLGIKVVHSRPRHPQTLGKEERFHGTLLVDVINQQSLPDMATTQEAFDQYRIIYNQHRPHQGINYQVPADRYQPSPRPFPDTIEPPTYPDHHSTRIVDAAARITYNGQRQKVGKPFKGKTVSIDPNTLIIYYRNQPIKHVNHVPEHP